MACGFIWGKKYLEKRRGIKDYEILFEELDEESLEKIKKEMKKEIEDCLD